MPTPGTIAIIILVVLILAVVVSCIQIVQQSKAYVSGWAPSTACGASACTSSCRSSSAW